MPFPPSLPTRQVSFGAAVILEDGTLLRMDVEIQSDRSLTWKPTGQPLVSYGRTFSAEEGAERVMSLPVTDAVGYINPETRQPVDVSDGKQSHSYSGRVVYWLGKKEIKRANFGPFILPADDGSVVDIDTIIPFTGPTGVTFSLPDRWTALVERAEAAAAEAAASVAIPAAFIGSEIGRTGSPAEEAVAAKIAPPIAAEAARADRSYQPTALPEAGALMRKLDLRSGDAVLAILTDSTGQGDTTTSRRWPYKVAQRFAARYPELTVTFYLQNGTPPGAGYAAPVTIQTGTGPYTLAIYNAAASGQGTDWALANLAPMLPVEPDLTIQAYGHNESLTYTKGGSQVRLARAITKLWPRTPIALMAQNPGTSAHTAYLEQRQIRHEIARIAAREHYGFIDIASPFFAYPNWETALMADDRHPNDTGYEFFADLVFSRFSKSGLAPASRKRPTSDRLYYPASMFNRSLGTPEMVYATNGAGRSGWALDKDTAEGVTAVVDVPADWVSLNFYLEWTTLVAPGGLGPGVVAWDTGVGGQRPSLGDTAVTYPINMAPPTTGFGSGNRLSETVPATGEVGWLRRRNSLAGTPNAYPANMRGLHELHVSRGANSGADTLPIDAVFLGVWFERVE